MAVTALPSDESLPTSEPLNFACTACGRCCHDLRLPLSISEAIGWIERGGRVEILCDAAPALEHPASGTDFRASRSIPTRSGTLPVALGVTLTAVFEGPCPHLLPNMHCGAYEQRPNVCRIYPAELRPDRSILPDEKLCPSEAWDEAHPEFVDRIGDIKDPETSRAVSSSRSQGPLDVQAKGHLLAALELNMAALANEGFAVWKPDQQSLLSALREALQQDMAPGSRFDLDLRIVSERPETLRLIDEAGAKAELAEPGSAFDYIALY